MDALNFVTAIRGLINEQVAEVHTSLPVRVIGVDYGSKTVTLESIVKNTRSTEDEIDYPTFHDVPFMVNGGGTGRISFPIKAGDIGVVVFSERDPSNAFQTDGDTASSGTLIQPCGLYPACFIPKIATATDSSEEVDSEKVVISNNKQTYASFDPNGNISVYNTQGMKIDMTQNSIVLTDAGGGKLTLQGGTMTYKGGTVNLNGLTITPDGRMTDSGGIGLHTHTHPVRGVETGGGTVTSDKPNGG